MPTIAANADRWTKHDWVGRGDEWSPGGGHAGTDLLWWRTLLPRIRTFVPAGTILEIGPGYGRWTEYLRTLCGHLIAIDVTPACIDACRTRFAGHPAIEFHVNDGTSLEAAADGSVDFVFSFDSLVHAEGDVLDRYVSQLSRILTPTGAAFLHHSNLGAFVDPATHDVRSYVTRRHWRATTMSARRLRDACRRADLRCTTQELINWIGRGRNADRPRLPGRSLPLTDCLSIVRRRGPEVGEQTHVVVNPTFIDEWRAATWLASAYPPVESERPAGPTPSTSFTRKLSTASTLLTRGPAVLARVAGDRARTAGMAARAWTMGQIVRHREPFVRSLRASKCPDCGASLEHASRCRSCAVVWTLA